MAGLSRYEKIVLGLTAVFVLGTGSWFLAQRWDARAVQVTTTRQETAVSSQPAETAEDECPDSLLEGEVIDLNAASVYDLQRLPGIGEKRAQAIVTYREEHGPFQSVEDLIQVDGIGSGILSGLTGYVTVGEMTG